MKANTQLFEISWEVCNPIGGIFTYVTSKIPVMKSTYGEDYLLIGPYFPDQLHTDFTEIETAADAQLATAISYLRNHGYEARYGSWKVRNVEAKALLINPNIELHKLNAIKARLWSRYTISSLDHDLLRDQSLAFGEGTRLFISFFAKNMSQEQDLILQFHDWLPSASIPDLIFEQARVAVVYNAHATLLGRCLAPQEDTYFHHMPYYDWQHQVHRFGIAGRAAIEREAARQAHVLVTNSEITARECECFHDRTPDYMIRNGVDEKPVRVREQLEEHLDHKAQIDAFVKSHFKTSYTFDTGKTLYFFTAGRYEFFNKGFDITLAAISRLNQILKAHGTEINVVFFIVSKKPHFGVPTIRAQNALPPVTTHQLMTDDEISFFLRHEDLVNQEDNPVKVIYHPDFIEHNTSPLGMDYEDFVRGCHLGIFPSLYEPWGYAPMEAALHGTPIIVSDLSGFGRYIQSVLPPEMEESVRIVYRRYHSDEEAVERLATILFDFIETYRTENKIPRVDFDKSILDSLCWTELMRYYRDVYKLALMRHQPAGDLY